MLGQIGHPISLTVLSHNQMRKVPARSRSSDFENLVLSRDVRLHKFRRMWVPLVPVHDDGTLSMNLAVMGTGNELVF